MAQSSLYLLNNYIGEMSLNSSQALLDRITSKTAQLVVIGLGYVGLPVAARFAQAGFQVTGLEIDGNKVAQVNTGGCPIEGEEPDLADLVREMVISGRLCATSDYGVCHQADVILFAVETPIDSVNQPRYTALRAALRALEPNLRQSAPQLVIVESTIAPGTMTKLVRPTLEGDGCRRAGEDFFLVHCPERVMPGLLLTNLTHMSRVVGGHTPEGARLAQTLYAHVVEADLDLTDCVTAELVKTAENAYRDVQIAFANELALICEQVGADVWRVRELVNKSPGRDVLLPGAGVGGHCIPKDPWLLAYGANEMVQAKLIPAAREINDYMPLHMAELTMEALDQVGIEIEDARVAVLGYAYLENSDDTRNAPSITLINRLEELGAEVCIHDPYVAQYRGNLAERVRGCDAVVVMVRHDLYRELNLGRLSEWLARSTQKAPPVLVDGRRVFNRDQAQEAGFVFRGIGIGTF
jgi:UDP-N-acetyl-D-mannosaminuronic acid dehydrogenase